MNRDPLVVLWTVVAVVAVALLFAYLVAVLP